MYDEDRHLKLEKYLEDFDKSHKLSVDWDMVHPDLMTINPNGKLESEQLEDLVNSAYLYAVDHLEKSGVTRERIRLSCATISYIIHKKLEFVEPELLSEEMLHSVHSDEMIQQIKEFSSIGDAWIDLDTYISFFGEIDPEKIPCDSCYACVDVCPVNAISAK